MVVREGIEYAHQPVREGWLVTGKPVVRYAESKRIIAYLPSGLLEKGYTPSLSASLEDIFLDRGGETPLTVEETQEILNRRIDP